MNATFYVTRVFTLIRFGAMMILQPKCQVTLTKPKRHGKVFIKGSPLF